MTIEQLREKITISTHSPAYHRGREGREVVAELRIWSRVKVSPENYSPNVFGDAARHAQNCIIAHLFDNRHVEFVALINQVKMLCPSLEAHAAVEALRVMLYAMPPHDYRQEYPDTDIKAEVTYSEQGKFTSMATGMKYTV